MGNRAVIEILDKERVATMYVEWHGSLDYVYPIFRYACTKLGKNGFDAGRVAGEMLTCYNIGYHRSAQARIINSMDAEYHAKASQVGKNSPTFFNGTYRFVAGYDIESMGRFGTVPGYSTMYKRPKDVLDPIWELDPTSLEEEDYDMLLEELDAWYETSAQIE